MQTLRWLSLRGPKPTIRQSVCWCSSCLEYTETVLLFPDTGWGGAAARRLCSSGLPLHEESHGITLPCTREAYQSQDLSAWCRKWGQSCWQQEILFTLYLNPALLMNFVWNMWGHFFSVVVYQVIELRRPSDSRLEHVDFDSLFSCLSVRQVIRVFASLLLERRVIFVAEKLRWGWGLVRETLSLSLFTLRCVSSFLLA